MGEDVRRLFGAAVCGSQGSFGVPLRLCAKKQINVSFEYALCWLQCVLYGPYSLAPSFSVGRPHLASFSHPPMPKEAGRECGLALLVVPDTLRLLLACVWLTYNSQHAS